MASTLFAYEGNHNPHAFNRKNAMKRNRISADGLLIELPSNFLGPETVGESDVRSQKTADTYPGMSCTPSEAASEDSCSVKRKFMSLKWDSFGDAINSGAAYLSSGNPLTRDEKKQLRKRLKIELDQVHKLMLRLEARELDLRVFLHMPKLENNGPLSKSGCELLPAWGEISQNEGTSFPQPVYAVTNLHPGAGFKEKRTLKASQHYSDAEFVLGRDSMLFSEKLKPKLVGVKRSLQLKGDLPDVKRQKMDTTNMRKLTELMRQCSTILKKLMSHRYGWIFNEPVDVVKLGLHDYFKIIEKPMDLGTIKSKLECGKYKSPLEFAEDVRLTFVNAMKYNPKGHDVHIMADVLRMLFEDRWRSVAEKLKHMTLNSDGTKRQVCTSVEMVARETLPLVCTRRSHAAATARHHSQFKSAADNFSKREMTFEEKRALSKMLENLPLEKSEEVILIVKKKNSKLRQIGDAFEVDIESVDSETLWELHNLVTNWNNAEMCIQEVLNMSQGVESVQVQSIDRASKSSKTASRGFDSREEDIDVGVEVPSASFPPTDIGKDGATTKGSSSSSSSSDSGSSSSDSESGSSSGSESDADDAQSPGAGSNISPEKEPVGSGAVCEQRGSPALEVDGAKRPLNDPEDGALLITSAADQEIGQQGEAGAPERQLSPEKVLRAALLKSRFADIIVKSQEKTSLLAKSDMFDPEKVKKQQEEVEKRQREEKARLQAEAKAAEIAWKKAEADAAAEAKRQREAERKAARLVLQQMEKMVDMDENNDLLKDLEMLRTASLDHMEVSNSVDEFSLPQSPDGLPAFTLQSSNPLEQLGLFMKADEDEDDQGTELPPQ